MVQLGEVGIILLVVASLVSVSVVAQSEATFSSLPACDAVSKRSTSTVPLTLIPKLRHVIWKNKTLPTTNSQEIFGNWTLEEPNFDHIIHGDDDCLEMAKMFTDIRAGENIATSEIRFLSPTLQQLAQRQYHYNFTQVYMDYQLHVMRADVCRVLSVYIHGGIYTDLDVRYKQPVADWGVRWDTFDILLIPENHVHVNNFMLGASPRHPCLRVVLEAMLREAQDPFPFRRTRHGVHHSTGPAIFTVALTSCRIDASYFSAPKTLYREEKTAQKNSQCLVKADDLVPYTPAYDVDNVPTAPTTTLYRVTPAFSRIHLNEVVTHEGGSAHWKNEGGYEAWTKRRDQTEKDLELGKAVDSIGGRKLWPVVRSSDKDEKFPTLLPKKKHVVVQAPHALKRLPSLTSAWEKAEPHFATVLHSTENCFGMAFKFNLKVNFDGVGGMPDVVCGLLGLYFEGGLYMDASICPKTPMVQWGDMVPWRTMDLFVTSSSENDQHPSVGMKMLGSIPKHHCIKKALQSLNAKDASLTSAALTEKLSKSISSCSVDSVVTDIDKEWTVHYTNGFKKFECLRSWVEEEGGRRLEQNYKVSAVNASIYTIQPVISDHQLVELVALAGTDGRC